MAEFKQSEFYFGFRLQKIEEIADIHSTAYLFFHEKSGARLLYLRNTDHNKVFHVTFKTPPTDDCGTPHILEHSVLCGSRKYEAKDPFNELAKGSLNTFLNALTYADKTMYPIASCNEKDFHNLMDVYLDAVFFPKIYEKKEIFQQEGWRYLLDDAQEITGVTGVVYNEMKGALSDPESLLGEAISRSVFGKSTYGFESGGLPSAILNLTYERFLDFHRKYYHPSNAYFYLYGDMEPMACLRHISDDYLDSFEKSNDLPVIMETECLQKGKFIHETYVGEGKGAFLAYNVKVGKCTDPERILALQILSYILLETNASPIKRALTDAGVCREAEGWFDSSTYEMVFSIIAKQTDIKKQEEFCRIIESQWQQLLAEGLPKDLVQSALRKFDFLLREEDYGSTPKGLIYASRAMKRWLHGENPCDSLRLLQIMERLKQDSRYFEKLIDTVFLHNEDKTYLAFTPEKDRAEREKSAFAANLEKRKAEMTENDLAVIRAEAEKLERFQTQTDGPEILAQIPLLEISEIASEPIPAPYHVKQNTNRNTFLYAPLEANGIVYWMLLFDMAVIPEDLLPYAGLLTELLGKLDTVRYSYSALATAINQVFGSFSMQINTYSVCAEEYRAFVTAKAKLLCAADADAALALTEEILLHTKYGSVESMKKILHAAKIKKENELLNQSHSFAIFYGGSNIFPALRIEDLTNGIRYYRFLCETINRLEQDASFVIEKLRYVAKILFTRQNSEAALGCAEGDAGEIYAKINIFLQALPSKEQKRIVYNFSLLPERAAFTHTGGVLYNTASFDYHKNGLEYHGKYQVLKTIVNLEYLWNQVRVQGGAYGCGCQFTRSGFSYIYSYRDPNLTETYQRFQSLAAYIRSFDADGREMTKYILGTINTLDRPKTNMEQLSQAVSRFYRQITDTQLQQERTEILQTTAADIRSCQDLLLCDMDNLCSIGDEQKIKAHTGLFTKIDALTV